MRTRSAVDWLLASEEPAIRRLAASDLLGEDSGIGDSEVLGGPIVGALLDGQSEDGGFGGHPYRKWGGAHWRLVSLVELRIPKGEPRAVRAAGTVLRWIASPAHVKAVGKVAGRYRRCASQEGNALAVTTRLGLGDDPRVRQIAASLIEWQWPDGGWNCDRRPEARRSSFHESLSTAWGLHEFASATGDGASADAARRAAELFLDHRLFRSLKTGEVMHRDIVRLHWPPYWRYDVLRALVVVMRMGLIGDPRTSDALDLLEERRLDDGRWQPDGSWWVPPGSKSPGSRGRAAEVVDWGCSGPNEMITLHALTVLRAAGRL